MDLPVLYIDIKISISSKSIKFYAFEKNRIKMHCFTNTHKKKNVYISTPLKISAFETAGYM